MDIYSSSTCKNRPNMVYKSQSRQYDIEDQNTNEEFRNPRIRFNANVRNGRYSQGYCYRRPSLQSRLQDGKSLELCFVNEQSTEFDDSYIEDEMVSLPVVLKSKFVANNEELNSLSTMQRDFHRIEPLANAGHNTAHDDNNNAKEFCDDRNSVANRSNINLDAFRRTVELRNDVCVSLKKVYANTRRAIEIENRQRSESPITRTIKNSLEKVGETDGTKYNGRRRMNRHMLTKMNANQLQIIIDDLHTHVKYLNEQLMKMLVERDDLHMSRDSLLVDIEDITAYLETNRVYQKNSPKCCISNEINYISN